MVIDIIIQQMPAFKRVYKKLHKQHQDIVNQAISSIVKNPTIGEEKKGDLAGIFVYKFKMYHQEFLLAYEWDPINRVLLALGVHENFYRDLKKVP
jgi:mRNA-degrading endonuclease RelE of RelBE toxin-antitoxin system